MAEMSKTAEAGVLGVAGVAQGAGKQGVLDQLGMARGYFFWDGTILMNDIKDDIYIYRDQANLSYV